MSIKICAGEKKSVYHKSLFKSISYISALHRRGQNVASNLARRVKPEVGEKIRRECGVSSILHSKNGLMPGGFIPPEQIK